MEKMDESVESAVVTYQHNEEAVEAELITNGSCRYPEYMDTDARYHPVVTKDQDGEANAHPEVPVNLEVETNSHFEVPKYYEVSVPGDRYE